jgi:sn-glycerol 3-phosphate transport system permease protein
MRADPSAQVARGRHSAEHHRVRPSGGHGQRRSGWIWRFLLGRAGRYLLLVIMAVVVGFPIYITVVNALLTPAQIAHRPPILFPTHPQWSAFSLAWSQASLDVYLRNSLIVSVAISLFEVMTSVLAAYAFAFVRFPFRRLFFVLCLATLMVPMEAIIVPNRQTIVSLGWFNSFPALIVPFMASGLGIFLFRQVFLQLPPDLRDAATLDGYGHLRFLTRVVLPINRPMIGAFALYSFLGAWNQYLWPLIVTDTNSVRTVQIGLRQLSSLSVDQINVIFAGTLLASLPIFALLLVFQRQLVRGLTAGAVKG